MLVVGTRRQSRSCAAEISSMNSLPMPTGFYTDSSPRYINYTILTLYRNRAYLSEATLLRYSRLCNILLKQGRVSASLRAITINMLGSDVSKIAFFKEFEMWDQLRAFYSSKSRWFEYYDLSVAVGDIPAAIGTLLVHKLMPVVDKPVVEKLFNYSMVEVLYAHRNLIPAKPERDGLLKSVKLTYLEKLGAQWRTLLQLIDDLEDTNLSASVKHLDKGLLKDIFCLFVCFQSNHHLWVLS
jgi:hypothetical protein